MGAITQFLKRCLRVVKGPFDFVSGFRKYSKSERPSETQRKFLESLSFSLTETKKGNENGIVLVQMVMDYEYLIKLAAASKAIAEKKDLEIHFYNVDWMEWIGWPISQIKSKYRHLQKPALEKMYLQFGKKSAFHCGDKYHDQSFIARKLNGLGKELLTPDDILKIKFEHVEVGDLIYDTYLRYYHQPTIEEVNDKVLLIIEIALNVFYNFLHFLKHNKVKTLVNTYSSYIEHGITARICLDKNIDVYAVGSYSYIIRKLEKDFPYHQINHTLFDPSRKLSEAQLSLAKTKFTSRFEGKIDSATSYMRKSSYSSISLNPEIKEQFASKSRNIVIYAHDFYDSPHVNRLLQFPDLYQYLKRTLQALTELKGTNVFVKIHPNGIEGCKEKTIELTESFKKDHFHILDETVSNLSIVELKPDLIATARGTVCAEMAYFGIPTVALFDNLFVNFKFTNSCYDKESYFSILKGEAKPEIDFNKEAIYSFYYQAFLDSAIKEEQSIFTTLAAFKGDTFNDRYLQFLFSNGYLESRQVLVNYYSDAISGGV